MLGTKYLRGATQVDAMRPLCAYLHTLRIFTGSVPVGCYSHRIYAPVLSSALISPFIFPTPAAFHLSAALCKENKKTTLLNHRFLSV